MTAPDVVRVVFAVPGQPVPWKRPSHGRRAHTSRHDAYLAWRDTIGWHAANAINRQRLPKPMVPDDWDVALNVHIVGAPKTADWDNLGKAVSDALEGWCYANDRQVADARIVRHPTSFGQKGIVIDATAPVVAALPIPLWQLLANVGQPQRP